MNIFGQRLKYLRKTSSKTQADMATLLQVSVRQYQLYEADQSYPSFHGLIALADYFSVTLDYLVGRNDIKLFFEPDGDLFYYFAVHKNNKDNIPLHGSFKYSFGIYPNDKDLKIFLYLEEQPGGTLMNPNILHSISHLEFLSLVSLLDWKLHFKYNPFDKGNMDIIIPFESSDGHKYQGVKIDGIRPAHLYSINYGDYVEQYLKKSTAEKVTFLADYIVTSICSI